MTTTRKNPLIVRVIYNGSVDPVSYNFEWGQSPKDFSDEASVFAYAKCLERTGVRPDSIQTCSSFDKGSTPEQIDDARRKNSEFEKRLQEIFHKA